MTINDDASKTANTREELIELLKKKKPKIYQDAIKYTLACWTGIELSFFFEDKHIQKMDRATFLKELQETGAYKLEKDPNGGSEVIVHLTEKGRDEIINLFYAGNEKRELKQLIKKLDALMSMR